MLQDLVQSYTVMRDLYLVLPEEVGATVYQAVTSVMIDIVAALLAVVRSLSDLSEKGAKERLTLTGTFWEACAAVEKLPRNNLLATLGVIDGELGLAVDAQEELTTVNLTDHEAHDFLVSALSQLCESEKLLFLLVMSLALIINSQNSLRRTVACVQYVSIKLEKEIFLAGM
ncbi:Cyclin-D1-binding protein 1 [Homalodisca vitripennis]|nr:Cyclin-D1-binding protein 1 [Homalodisca vitripennis]